MKSTTPFTVALLAIASVAAFSQQVPAARPVSFATDAPVVAAPFTAPNVQAVAPAAFQNERYGSRPAAPVVLGNGWYKVAASTYEYRNAGKLYATVDGNPSGKWYVHIHAGTQLIAFDNLDAAKRYVASHAFVAAK